jgi:hypothetical protein
MPTIEITSFQQVPLLHRILTQAWRFPMKRGVARTKTFTSLKKPEPHQMFPLHIGNESHSEKGAFDEHPA